MLNGKVVIVTGAAIAQKLADKGAVVVSDIDQQTALAEAEALRAPGGRAIGIRSDVSRPEDAEAMAEAAITEFGRLDILMNNAGVSGTAIFLDTTREEMERILSFNLIGAMLCA